MPRTPSLRTLCALPLLIPGALAHMQMQEPSPLRDPHSNRTSEPKDYNILTPLHPDGSDFACKGYQWDTPLTTVATYHAGKTYPLRLMGGATHGGGSCQISLSCDYTHFNVIKSMEGNCPIEKEYEFTIPEDVPTVEKCLLAWTWFNKIGNREMYMNCAVVDLISASSFSSSARQRASTKFSSTAVAQAALSRYPDLYVANLKGVNDCATKETVNAVFDNPGSDVVFSDGLS
ncbi:lytic polysaccharide monooxygenase, partial [Karstenula rhodostoma CBS 690.94]